MGRKALHHYECTPSDVFKHRVISCQFYFISLNSSFSCFQNGWGDCYNIKWLIPEIMGQLYSVAASRFEVHDGGQAFSSTVELPVSTLSTEAEGNLQFFNFLNFLKKLLKFFYSIILLFSNSPFIKICFFSME